MKVLLSGTVKVGDPIGKSGATFVRALATVGTAIQAKFIALSDGVSGDKIGVALTAEIAGFTLGTIGGLVYVDEGATAGRWTETVPTTSGDTETPQGVITAADAIIVSIDPSESRDSVV